MRIRAVAVHCGAFDLQNLDGRVHADAEKELGVQISVARRFDKEGGVIVRLLRDRSGDHREEEEGAHYSARSLAKVCFSLREPRTFKN